MQDSINPSKMTKFRQTPLGKYIYDQEAPLYPLESYTQALLGSDTSKNLHKSNLHKRPFSLYSVPRGVSIPQRDSLSICWTRIEIQGWKPETRQEASLTHFNNNLYLIGGISRSINKDVNILKIASRTWERLENSGEVNVPRFGHSAVKYDGNIIIFGGGTHFDYKHRLRECLNGVHMFNVKTQTWAYMKTQGTYLPARKHHSAVVVGCHMLIYGGMNQKNNLLSDAAVLNLKKQSWKSVDIMGKSPGKLSFHSAVLVLDPQPRSEESIFKLSSPSLRISSPGIYMFGGLGQDKKATNILAVIQVGERPLKWHYPAMSGKPPSPRFLHTMNYNQSLNLIIIFGGRVDQANTSVYTCFNEVFLLDLQSCLWLKVNVMGEVPIGRAGHTAEEADCKLFVFGGVTNSCYCSGDIWMLELNQEAAQTLAESYNKKVEHENAVEGYKLKKEMEIVQAAGKISLSVPRAMPKNFLRSHTRNFTGF